MLNLRLSRLALLQIAWCTAGAAACGSTDESSAPTGGAGLAGHPDQPTSGTSATSAGFANAGSPNGGLASASGFGATSGGSAGVAAGGVGAGGGSAGQNAGTSPVGGTAAPSDGGTGDTTGASGAPDTSPGLSWPIDCIPNQTCVNLGYPDTDNDGVAHDCGDPGYPGHEGTDIGITFEARDAGTAVRAAADGVVQFAFDGKYDQCPNDNEPDCQDPGGFEAGAMKGTTVCTPVGPYCGTGQPGCFWCFAGGNVIVIRHQSVPGVFATRYDHLKKSSVLVKPGDSVKRGQKIAEAASAGNSTGPHLHFEVWGTGFYELADPWAGPCGPNRGPSLWAYDPPWSR